MAQVRDAYLNLRIRSDLKRAGQFMAKRKGACLSQIVEQILEVLVEKDRAQRRLQRQQRKAEK